MSLEQFGPQATHEWNSFIEQERLTVEQAEKFEKYLFLLLAWNQKTNLTRITDFSDIITLHFQDSLRIRDVIDFSSIKGICDIGTGAGFPGIPLSIVFSEISVILLEVNAKKRAFLHSVIQELGLGHTSVCELDWRTFIRQAPYPVDLFCARASLQPQELVRIFKPSSVYKNAQLVYWASRLWEPLPQDIRFVHKKVPYRVGTQDRMYVFFGSPSNE